MATDRSKKAKALADKAKDFVMLAHKYSPTKHIVGTPTKKQVDITNWGIYEKIDGIRAVFKDGALLSRYKNKFSAPPYFINLIQNAFAGAYNLGLDGELISKHGFQHTTSIVRDQTTKNTMEFWKDITFVVFDIQNSKLSFNDRLDLINNRYTFTPNIKVLNPITHVKDQHTVAKAHTKITKQGKEGLILRNPLGLYELGRSWDVLKVKEFIDIEVTVIAHFNGEGKHHNRLGKLLCRMPDGKEFECGTGFTDEERENPPKIGSKITIKYFELTDAGVPRFPIFISERDYE